MAQSGLNWAPSDSNFDALAHLSHSPLYLDFTVLLNPSLDSADLWQQATRVDFWIWIWPRLVQEAACWFQCWKNSTCFVWLIKLLYDVETIFLFSVGLGLFHCHLLKQPPLLSKKNPEGALYLYKSTIHPYMEYCCLIWADSPNRYLNKIYSQLRSFL